MKSPQSPEKRMKKKIIKDIEEAQKRIKESKGRVYTPQEFEAKFCG